MKMIRIYRWNTKFIPDWNSCLLRLHFFRLLWGCSLPNCWHAIRWFNLGVVAICHNYNQTCVFGKASTLYYGINFNVAKVCKKNETTKNIFLFFYHKGSCSGWTNIVEVKECFVTMLRTIWRLYPREGIVWTNKNC